MTLLQQLYLKPMRTATLGLCLTCCLVSLLVAAEKPITSSTYEWKQSAVQTTATGKIRSVLNGPTMTLELLDVVAITLNSNQMIPPSQIPPNVEDLLIVTDGSVEAILNGNRNLLGNGSVMLATPGDTIGLRNVQNDSATYVRIRFQPKNPPKLDQAKLDTAKPVNVPLVIDWAKTKLKETKKGGRRDIMNQPTALLQQLEIHVTTLNEGEISHAAHTHPDEEITLVRRGDVEVTIKGSPFRLGSGSLIFLSSNDLHGIRNAGQGQCEYYAIRWITKPRGP
jgi:quercetin dioxygenase-like cupin family protein